MTSKPTEYGTVRVIPLLSEHGGQAFVEAGCLSSLFSCGLEH